MTHPPLGKNILTLLTGNAVAFLVPILFYPVLSRLFTIEDYALYGLYSSIFALAEVSSVGRYEYAVPLPKQDDQAVNLVVGGALIALAYSLLTLLLIIIAGDFLAIELNNQQLAPWLYCIPIALVFISTSKLGNIWLLRSNKFKSASLNKASQKIGESISQFAFGILNNSNGLIIGDLVGRSLNSFFSIYQSFRSGFSIRIVQWSKIKTVLKSYSDFPKHGIVPSMLNTLAGMFPVLIVSAYFSKETSGYFNFSRIILSVPFALLAVSISQVVLQQVAELRNNNLPIQNLLRSLAIQLMLVSMAISFVLVAFAPELFAIVFGRKWIEAGQYTRILILPTTISLVVSSFSVLLSTLGRLRLSSIWQTGYCLIISLLWLVPYESISEFLIYLAVIDIVSYGIYGYIIFRTVKNYEKNLV